MAVPRAAAGQKHDELTGGTTGHVEGSGGWLRVATALNRSSRGLGGDGELPRRRIEQARRCGRELVAGDGGLASGW